MMVSLDLRLLSFGLECGPGSDELQFESINGKEEALVGEEADGRSLDVLLVGVGDELKGDIAALLPLQLCTLKRWACIGVNHEK